MAGTSPSPGEAGKASGTAGKASGTTGNAAGTAGNAAGAAGKTPGRLMRAEMAEQPQVLRRLLDEGAADIRETARRIAALGPRFVLLGARGTSDNAALYAKYLIEIELGLPCGLMSMSTTTAYGARPHLRDVLLITVSQSGGSPDLAASTQAARQAGAITLAVTNNADSPLAEVSQFHIDLLAGPEKALPATKTYTAELLALYLFVLGMKDDPGEPAHALPDLTAEVLARREEVRDLAGRYRFAERMVLTSRGYGYPTAKEAALKMMETSYIPALPYSGADLLHGPLAMVDNISPVIAIVTEGRGGQALRPVLDRLRGRGADLVVVGPHAGTGASVARQDRVGFALPTGRLPESLQPVLEILPLQELAFEIAIARGQDPDAPRGLAKVTETR